jgi:hypothetical protein
VGLELGIFMGKIRSNVDTAALGADERALGDQPRDEGLVCLEGAQLAQRAL